MALVSRLVGFDRATEQLVVQHEVPRSRIKDALKIAGLMAAEETLGNVELPPSRAAKVAQLLGKKIDTEACDFFLEFSAPVATGRRAVRA